MRYEWRNRNHEDDAVLAVDDGHTVVRAWEADGPMLTDLLNDMARFRLDERGSLDVTERDPQQWGGLVIARSENGEVLSVDPELYWDRVAYWFRSRGGDPHPWHKGS